MEAHVERSGVTDTSHQTCNALEIMMDGTQLREVVASLLFRVTENSYFQLLSAQCVTGATSCTYIKNFLIIISIILKMSIL